MVSSFLDDLFAQLPQVSGDFINNATIQHQYKDWNHQPIDEKRTPEEKARDYVLDGNAKELAILLKEYPEIHVNMRFGENGRALLHEACALGHREVIKVLLEQTMADLSLRSMLAGSSPLHIAVNADHRAIVFLLLSHGANARARDRFGSTPLHYVKSLNVAKLLLQYGAKILDCNLKRKHALQTVIQTSIEVKASSTLRKHLEAQLQEEYREQIERVRNLKKKK